MTPSFLKFLVTGGIAAVVNLACRHVINKFTTFETAVALAYLIGMTTAYVLSRRFVFVATGHSVATEFRRFAIVNAVGLVLVWLISVGLARSVFPAIGWTWHSNDLAHFIGVLSPAVPSYFGHRHYTFAKDVDGG